MADFQHEPPKPTTPLDNNEPAIVRVLDNFVHDILGGGSKSSIWSFVQDLADDVHLQGVRCGGVKNWMSGADSGSATDTQGGKTDADKHLVAGLALSDRGPIKNIQFPNGWQQTDSTTGGVGNRSIETYGPPSDKGVGISVFYGGLPTSDAGARAFTQLLTDKPATGGPQQLTADEIKSVADALGRLNVGDNQYTNTGRYRPPVFHIDSARTEQVNGRTVLAVEGDFVDMNGKPVKGFSGVFADTDGTGKRIQQVYLQGAPDKVPQYKKQLEETLSSIEWNR